MTAYDKATAERMIAELRQIAFRSPAPAVRDKYEAIADQLEAAKATIDQHASDLARWRQRNAEQAAGEAKARDQLIAERDALRAEVDGQAGTIARLQSDADRARDLHATARATIATLHVTGDTLRAEVESLKAELVSVPPERRSGSPTAQLRDGCRDATLAARKKE